MLALKVFNASVKAVVFSVFVADEMQYQTKGRFLPYTRKLGNLVHCILN